MAKGVTIGSRSFETQSAAIIHYREILHSYSPGSTLSSAHFDEVMALFKEHEEFEHRTSTHEVTRFEVHKAMGGTQCFYARYDDEKLEDFSFQNTIRKAATRQNGV